MAATARTLVDDYTKAVSDGDFARLAELVHPDAHFGGTVLAEADGAFVGSCFEPGGWGTQIDVDRVKAYMDIVAKLN